MMLCDTAPKPQARPRYHRFPKVACHHRVAVLRFVQLVEWTEAGYTRPMVLESVITCPYCGQRATEQMPTDACRFFYDCKGCEAHLKPKPGDCCVFCSYGSVPCPPIQANAACCSQ
jgi:hypothetical protein